MRVTSDPKDPDYRKEYIGCSIYLNGDEVRGCVMADDVAGIVTVAKRNEQGYMYCDGHGEFVTEDLRGEVRIVLPPVRVFKRGQF